ncbi:hypothetical protein LZ30DRAFT_302506 [Colletotrichum cereale]|nr:hypothetical protein LZ30DRAFT_302506 [Colletotrichum cereale]
MGAANPWPARVFSPPGTTSDVRHPRPGVAETGWDPGRCSIRGAELNCRWLIAFCFSPPTLRLAPSSICLVTGDRHDPPQGSVCFRAASSGRREEEEEATRSCYTLVLKGGGGGTGYGTRHSQSSRERDGLLGSVCGFEWLPPGRGGGREGRVQGLGMFQGGGSVWKALLLFPAILGYPTEGRPF